MRKKHVITNLASIQYHVYNPTTTSYREETVMTNSIDTHLYTLDIRLNSYPPCYLPKYCYCNAYQLVNCSPYTLYDVSIQVILPQSVCYVPESFCVNQQLAELSAYRKYYLPYIESKSCIHFNFNLCLESHVCSCTPISLVKVRYHYFDPIGNYKKRVLTAYTYL